MKTIKICEKAKVIVSKGGQVTIPIYIRERYGIHKGDMVVLEVKECVVEEVLERKPELCIKGSAEEGEEELLVNGINAMMDTLDVMRGETFEAFWGKKTPEEKNAKIDHIMGWLKPLRARLEETPNNENQN